MVDEEQSPGRYLLTGSTNFLTVPTISESLAGRCRILRLWPLSVAETQGKAHSIDTWFDALPQVKPELSRGDYLELVCRGGYPELARLKPSSHHAWVESYLETITQRDLVELAGIRKKTALSRLLTWAATHTSEAIKIATAASELGVDRATITSYFQWLEAVFLVHEVAAWSRKLSARSAKLHLTDTGLATQLLGLSPSALAPPTSPMTGPLLESFVVNEIKKQLSTSGVAISLGHYREKQAREIALMLERQDGAVLAIEVKATGSPTLSQLKHVAWMRDKLDLVDKECFKAGILLHTGTQCFKVGDRLHLLPIAALWA